VDVPQRNRIVAGVVDAVFGGGGSGKIGQFDHGSTGRAVREKIIGGAGAGVFQSICGHQWIN